MPANFTSLPLWLNTIVFIASAAAVWAAGTRLARHADAIALRTGVGQATLGVLLLGGVTSLPEIAVAGTASLSGDAPLAVNNLLGGFTMQVAILALADILIRRRALTAVIPDPIVLLQGALGIVLMSLVAMGVGVGDVAVLGAGAWTWAVLVVFLFSIRLVALSEGNPSWRIVGETPAPSGGRPAEPARLPTRRLVLGTLLAAGVILAMGYALSRSGEAIAEQSGLGSSFFGAVFVAVSTSLPEISTVLAAVRLGRYVMAVSDIFGTNLFDIGLVFLVDLLFRGGPVLGEVGTFSIVAAMLGVLVTAIYLAGLVERRDPALFGVGLDSIAVSVVYVGGLAVLYGLR